MTFGAGFQLYSARFPALFAFQNSFERPPLVFIQPANTSI